MGLVHVLPDVYSRHLGERFYSQSPFKGHQENGHMSSGNQKVVFRSSVTGRFVPQQYANTHKPTTEREHVPSGKK
jgi:hypothetical protein